MWLEGRNAEAIAASEQLVAEADRIGSLVQRARARRGRAYMLDEGGDTKSAEVLLWEAYRLAEQAGSPAEATRALAMLIVGVALRTERTEQAVSWIPFGDAALARAGNEPEDAAFWNRNAAMAIAVTGDLDRARARWEAARDLTREVWGEESCRYGETIGGLARVMMRQGELEPAASLLVEGLEACRHELPSDAPMLARMLLTLSDVLLTQGQIDEAATAAEEALQICEARPRGLTPIVAVLEVLAQVRAAQGRPDEAVRLMERAVELLHREGPQQLEAQALGLLANTLSDAGRNEEALSRAQQALTLLESLDQAESGSVAAAVQLSLGGAQCSAGQVELGRRSIARARTLLDEAGVPEADYDPAAYLAECDAAERTARD